MFNRFFNNANRMSSTYKPVFLRSLLDIGTLHDSKNADSLIGNQWIQRKDGKIHVDLNFIAVRFAKYYWDMEYSFHLRQSQDPQDANITRLVKAIHDPKKKPPTIKELSSNDMAEFRKHVIKKSIKPEVLIHLLTDMKDFYKKTDSKIITFDDDVIEFLYTHKTVIKKGLNHVMAKYLEKLNCLTPLITNKIDSESAKRTNLKSELQLEMSKWQNTQCFYCKNKLNKPHVDHVIPFNFIFSTDLYNCVLACQQCNCTKSDMLPHRDFFDNVLERNDEITDYLNQTNLLYNKDSYVNLFDNCATEYNRSVFFSPNI